MYNLGHTLLGPAALIAWGALADAPLVLAVGAVWLAHIGMDCARGFGLEHDDAFSHAHWDDRARQDGSCSGDHGPMSSVGARGLMGVTNGAEEDRTTWRPMC